MIAEKLRKSILQAAIQGKLTEQLESDEDARDLVAEIEKEKARLIKEGKIKKGKPLPEITEEEIPFEIPENWCWVRLGDIVRINPRNKIENDILVSFIPMALLDGGYSNSFSYEERLWKQVNSGYTHFANNDVVLAKITPCFQNRKSAVMKDLINGFGAGTTELHVLRPINDLIASEYILYLVKTEYFIGDGVLSMTGTAGQQRVGKEYIKNFLCPLPPKNEQVRIVNKILELLSEIQKLHDEEEKLEILQKSFPKKMKDSLLQAAIQGKLTEQLESFGDAKYLVTEIQNEKARLIKEGKIKKEKPLPEITEDEIPFEIPENWCWVRLGEIGSWVAGATPNRAKKEYYFKGTIPWLKTGDLNDGVISEIPEYITEFALRETSVKLLPKGAVLIAMYGATIGKIGMLDLEATTNQACCGCVTFSGLCNWYLFYFLMSYKTQFIRQGAGGAQPNISREKIVKTLIPLPPLAEQHRIVERLEQLLPFCDALE
jgi:type I restriction enzyme S subunit